MSDLPRILGALDEVRIHSSGTIFRDEGTDGVYFVPVEVARDSENRQTPSNLRLKEVRDRLAVGGIKIEFLLSDPRTRDIEGGLRATLLHRFGDSLRNVFLSLEKSQGIVWLDTKHVLNDSELFEIKRHGTIYLDGVDIKIQALLSTSGSNLPSNLVCLDLIRRFSPISMSHLKSELVDRGLTVPSDDWLARRLDALRKLGKVVRLTDGSYALTILALRELGTVKGQRSPDVARLLAVARGGR